MDIPTLIQFLNNKSAGLKAKMQEVKTRGNLDSYEIFSGEWADTQVSIRLLNKAQDDIHYYTNNEVKEKLKAYLLEEVPDLALYFKTDSINKVLSDSVDKAFERVSEEHFKSKLVSITGGE